MVKYALEVFEFDTNAKIYFDNFVLANKLHTVT